MIEGVLDDVLTHALGHVRLDHAHDRDVGQRGIGQHMLNACPHGHDRLQPGKAGKIAGRRRQDESVGDAAGIRGILRREEPGRCQPVPEGAEIIVAPGLGQNAEYGDIGMQHARGSPVRGAKVFEDRQGNRRYGRVAAPQT